MDEKKINKYDLLSEEEKNTILKLCYTNILQRSEESEKELEKRIQIMKQEIEKRDLQKKGKIQEVTKQTIDFIEEISSVLIKRRKELRLISQEEAIKDILQSISESKENDESTIEPISGEDTVKSENDKSDLSHSKSFIEIISFQLEKWREELTREKEEAIREIEQTSISKNNDISSDHNANTLSNSNLTGEIVIEPDKFHFNTYDLDLSELYDSGALTKREKANRYRKEEHDEWEFDWKSEKFYITNLGRIDFYTSVELGLHLNEYKVTRANKDGNKTEMKSIFTNLDISKLENDNKYRGIVFEYLLNPQNLRLKNSYGYVGEISQAQFDETNYAISFFSHSYTAVARLREFLGNGENTGDKFKNSLKVKIEQENQSAAVKDSDKTNQDNYIAREEEKE